MHHIVDLYFWLVAGDPVGPVLPADGSVVEVVRKTADEQFDRSVDDPEIDRSRKGRSVFCESDPAQDLEIGQMLFDIMAKNNWELLAITIRSHHHSLAALVTKTVSAMCLKNLT